jgi:hypothetical protein
LFRFLTKSDSAGACPAALPFSTVVAEANKLLGGKEVFGQHDIDKLAA